MHIDQTDPIEASKEITFRGDPVELINFGNSVTMRKAKEGEDKYDLIEPGDEFNFNLFHEGIKANLGKGQVVAHWKLPFRDIPTEIICGEEFQKQFLYPNFLARERMEEIMKIIYGNFNKDTLTHVFVYVYPDEIYERILDNFDIYPHFFKNPDLFFKEYLSEEYIQKEGESPEEWVSRECSGYYHIKDLGELFFGLNNSYRMYMRKKALNKEL